MTDITINVEEITGEAIERANKIGPTIQALKSAIDALPDGEEKTNLQRLEVAHHYELNSTAKAFASKFGFDPKLLSGGTEK